MCHAQAPKIRSMSSFFSAAQNCEVGKQRPKHESNVALLRLPASSPANIKRSACFLNCTTKPSQRGDPRRYFALPATQESQPSGLPFETHPIVSTNPTSIPEDLRSKQQAHRDALLTSKEQLLRLEERDADDIARRIKAKRLEAERQQRIRRIAAGLQDISTIDYDPEDDLPKLRQTTLGIKSLGPKNGILTATTTVEDTISDHSNLRLPTLVYATEEIYNTPTHVVMAEAAANKALEGGSQRLGAASGQLRMLLQRQQNETNDTDKSRQVLSPGEKCALSVKEYLRGKYGPSMLWSESPTLMEGSNAQTNLPRRLQNQSASQLAEVLLAKELRRRYTSAEYM